MTSEKLYLITIVLQLKVKFCGEYLKFHHSFKEPFLAKHVSFGPFLLLFCLYDPLTTTYAAQVA